jgi:Helix-turn-helix domain
VRPGKAASRRVALQLRRLLLPAFITVPVDPLIGVIGRRASGAPLYHCGSQFGPPERRKLDRNLVAKILFLAEALDRRTRGPRQHGGLLKAKGLDVLRALLRRFYSYCDGTCFPSYDAIAEAAGCCRATVAAKLRILEQLGIVETIRRKVVASFTSRVHRVRFDAAVQTSNSYRFNLPIADRPQHGDAALPLLKPAEKAESKSWAETSSEIKTKGETDLAAAKTHWLDVLLGTSEVG